MAQDTDRRGMKNPASGVIQGNTSPIILTHSFHHIDGRQDGTNLLHKSGAATASFVRSAAGLAARASTFDDPDEKQHNRHSQQHVDESAQREGSVSLPRFS
jgi:hypothetical protein